MAAGEPVTAEQMKHLFGTGCHPLRGVPLGSAYKVYDNQGVDGFNIEVVGRLEALGVTAGRPAKLPASASSVTPCERHFGHPYAS